jgi:hypothetical protein
MKGLDVFSFTAGKVEGRDRIPVIQSRSAVGLPLTGCPEEMAR